MGFWSMYVKAGHFDVGFGIRCNISRISNSMMAGQVPELPL
jgi:hypothetical protein